MTNRYVSKQQRVAMSHSERSGREKPAWANGIKALYDAVTEEPLPVDFEDLLDRLSNAKHHRNHSKK